MARAARENFIGAGFSPLQVETLENWAGGLSTGGTGGSGLTTLTGLVPDDPTAALANSAIIQAALGTALAPAGGLIMFPAGTFYVRKPHIMRYTPKGLRIMGQGMGVTVLQQVEDGAFFNAMFRRLSTDDTNFALGGTCIFSDLTLRGTWQTTKSLDLTGGMWLICADYFDYLDVNHVEFTDGRYMALRSAASKEVTVSHCRFQRITRDMVNLTRSFRTKVVNNTMIDGGDDSIAVHTNISQGEIASQWHICANNYIENVFGIKYLGGNKLTIHDNVLVRPKCYAIQFKEANANGEGEGDMLDVNIHDNIITDIIAGTTLGYTDASQVGIWLASSSFHTYYPIVTGGVAPGFARPNRIWPRSNTFNTMSMTTNGTAVVTGLPSTSGLIVGQPIGGTGIPAGTFIKTIDSPTQITLTKAATDSSTGNRSFRGNTGTWGVRVHNNIIRQTLWNTALYSDWGFTNKDGNLGAWKGSVGTISYINGYVNPSMLGKIERVGNGIAINQTIGRLELSDNTIEGFETGIDFQSGMQVVEELHVRRNNISRVATAGIALDRGSAMNGTVYLDDNFIDGDPWFESSNRAGVITQNGNTTTSAVVTALSDTSLMLAGMRVSGLGVVEGTTVLSVDSPTQITLSLATISTLTATPISVGDKDGTWTAGDSTPRGIDKHLFNGIVSAIGNTFRNINECFYPDTNLPTIIRGTKYIYDNLGVYIGGAYTPRGIRVIGPRDPLDWVISEDSSPLSANYGKPLAQTGSSTMFQGVGVATARYYAASDAGAIITGQAIGASFLVASPFIVPSYQGFDQCALRVDTAEAATLCRVGLYSSLNGVPDLLIQDFGEIDLSATGLRTTTAILPRVVCAPGAYWLVSVFNANTTLRINRHVHDSAIRQRMLGVATDTVASGSIEATFTWDPASVASGAFNAGITGIAVPGVAFGDRPFVKAPYDTQGLILTPRITAADTMAVSIQNPTAGAIDLANSAAWMIGADKVSYGDFHVTKAFTYAALPAVFPGPVTRSATGTDPHILIRRSV